MRTLAKTTMVTSLLSSRFRPRAAALATLLALVPLPLLALWPQVGGGTLAENVFDSTADSNGNVYVVGEFRGTATFGSTTLNSEGLTDVFVAKYDQDGLLIWARSAGGPSVDRGAGIAVDAGQNVYVTGYFTGSIGFPSQPGQPASSVNLPNINNPDTPERHELFVAKIKPNGDWDWARQMGGPGHDEGLSIAIAPGVEDPNDPVPDGVIVAGKASCPHFYDSDGTYSSISNTIPCGPPSIVVARLSTIGEWVWSLGGGTQSASEWATDVAVDAGGRVYVAGVYLQNSSIATPVPTALTFNGIAGGATLSFWQSRNFENDVTCWDAGVLEYSTDSGGNWYDILAGDADNDPTTTAGDLTRITSNGYNGVVATGSNSPIANRRGWCNNNGGFQNSIVDLSDFATQSVRFRWRMASDEAVADVGWYLDDFTITDGFSNTLFSDNLESGAGKWTVSSPSGASPFSISNGASHSPSNSWFVTDEGSISDHRVAMTTSVAIPEGRPSYFVAKVSNADTFSPFWQWATGLPTGVSIGGIASDGAARLYLAGTALNAGTVLGGLPALTNAGAFVAKINDNGASYTWSWDRGVNGGSGKAIALDTNGDAYLAGDYTGAPAFTTVQIDPLNEAAGTHSVTLTAAQGTDVFVAKVNSAGSKWRWVQSANPSPNDEHATTIAARGTTQAWVSGSFDDSATFGTIQIVAQGATDAYVANLNGGTGVWFQVDFQHWVAGEEVTPPQPLSQLCLSSDTLSVPAISVTGSGAATPDYFFWSPPSANLDGRGHLYAIQPTNAEVKWKKSHSGTGDCNVADTLYLTQTGAIDWPRQGDGSVRYCGSLDALANPTKACVQLHVAGAPVDVEPVTSNLALSQLVHVHSGDGSTDSNVNIAAANQSVFTATAPGFSVLLYSLNPASRDLSANRPFIRLVRSVAYDTSLQIDGAPIFTDGAACTIGQQLTEATHQEHANKNGAVLFERAYFDGEGPDRAYDRVTRLGQIVPVNRVPIDSDGQDLMAIAWYRFDAQTIAWPVKPVRYDCKWPANPDKIIVASELGSEVLGQPPLDPLVFLNMRIYNQPQKSKSGFNPNDEHALFAPANSQTGFNALFALRDDFTAAELNKTSEPYSILKYQSPGSPIWHYRIYQVLATGAGYDSFQYSGVAGNAVFPPYPVRLLGNCEQSDVSGRPAFKDYKNQVWAKAAGTLVAQYWYPLQPTFYYDRDADRTTERTTGDCIAWLGGPTDDPVDVHYTITWPANVPLLEVGETLLTPKRGLPDIADQAAVEVIFDEKADRLVDTLTYSPATSLVRLIDPLSSRVVRLQSIPSAVSTELESETGFQIPVSNSDGTIKLPSTIRDRIYYDPLNKKLAYKGIFDESGAGDPLLLINVMTDPERRRLKQLDGGDGTEQADFDGACLSVGDGCTWDQAIEALYRLSRNPNRLDLDLETNRCHLENQLDPTTGLLEPHVVCTSPTDGEVDNQLLLGMQDLDNDHVPEALQVVGFTPALTAGFAQGTGYVTVAFNNDPSLNPLPVSLNVIRVGCLDIPPDQQSMYQGQINVIPSDNVFDEALTLRHSGDFAGNSDGIEFEWFFHPDEDGTPPTPLPDPDNGQMNGWLQFTQVPSDVGAIDITIEGANIQTLSDNWFVVRYRYVDPPMDVGADGIPNTGDDAPLCGGSWTVYAGQPGSTPTEPRAQLAEGWVKRVVRGLNPFEARVQDFHAAETNTYASMLFQLGERYEGDIAFSPDASNLNSIGLIEAYTTVFNRAKRLSIDGTPPVNYAPVNSALLLVASRISDFYTLLGNEAYADAQDPMIGFGTDSDAYGSLAPSIFTFQNQLDSLLEEEVTLLRGRDDSQAPVAARPVYNRLFWNFTSGDGEVAYALTYNITDQNLDGVVNESDARVLFPQAHGDAWGHYLTAMTTYYGLLRHPFFTWLPRPEAVLVAGVPVQVDYLDERKFAKTAAAKAKAGAEIVNLTYRLKYVEDPAGQWQGYKDTNAGRAWGLSEWGRRAGQGAYFDWVVANAILPEEDPNPEHVGIQKIDRKTVRELGEIADQYSPIQAQLDQADNGLNPLGLAKGVVIFDIDPALLNNNSGAERDTHFEQVFQRTMKAMGNAIKTFNFANELTNLLRQTQDAVEDIYSNSYDQEIDYRDRLIEIFGYPYDADIGTGGTYPEGYDGPDVYHYMYVDQTDLTGAAGQENQVFTATFQPTPSIGHFDFDSLRPNCTNNSSSSDDCAFAPSPTTPLNVGYSVATNFRVSTSGGTDTSDSFFLVKPGSFANSSRRATGELQDRLSDLLVAMNGYRKVLTEYNNLIDDIKDARDLLKTQYDVEADKIEIKNQTANTLRDLNVAIGVFDGTITVLRRVALFIDASFKNTAECIPKSVIAGLAAGGDMLSTARCAIQFGSSAGAFAVDTVADGLEIVKNSMELAKEDVEQRGEIKVDVLDARLEVFNKVKELEKTIREEAVKRLEAYEQREIVDQARSNYLEALASGQRTLSELIQFRKNTAADIQTYRYKDMAFRIFRNDALQKYRAQFELAARYTYLAATAYDYETNLLASSNLAGRNFLTQIVRERSLGQLNGDDPVPGSKGLAGPLGAMQQNFDVLKGQLGFTNPQVETNRFSLRKEAFRLEDDADQDWEDKLQNEFRVDNLWNVPEFRRYCKPFAPESQGPQPGLVIPFETTVTSGQNFFGWPLAGGDSAYDASHFATKINSVGTWFVNYSNLPLSNTPRVYLIPVGADILRSPSDDLFTTREWQVVEQSLPVPFPIGDTDLNDPTWIPKNDSVSEAFGRIRRMATYRAYHTDSIDADIDLDETAFDSRLVCRSVWNRKWLLIIPGATLLADPNEGLDTFIHGELVPGGNGERDGNGVKDIGMYFSTYAYTGN
jgi:hypothetical protein